MKTWSPSPSLSSGSQPPIHDSPFTIHQHIRAGFTIIELLVVTGIVALLMVLVVPAFTNIKSAGDVTSAAYTIKGVLEQARSYAMANNTYTWVGFTGSIGTSVTGQVSMAVIASNDGTQLGSSSGASGAFVIGTGSGTAAQVGKLTQLQNTHIGDTSGAQYQFGSRPAAVQLSATGTSSHPFTVQQTTFNEWIQFSPRGEALINGGSTSITPYIEVGVLPTHGSALTSDPNIAPIQISGLGGNVNIYRR